jgi:hypothetical protein
MKATLGLRSLKYSDRNAHLVLRNTCLRFATIETEREVKNNTDKDG